MKERRSLVEGLKSPEVQKLEEAFVFGDKRVAEPIATVKPANSELPPEEKPAVQRPDRSILPQMTGRIPVTTRCRPEVASALKRASLQRQLEGAEPFYVQDIMEEALENWLRDKDYI